VANVVIVRLEDHPHSYVTVGALAQYWAVSRKQIYKHIENGTLTALRFGPRLLRIQTAEARRFEREARMIPLDERERSARLQHITTTPAKAESPQPGSRQKAAVGRSRPRSSPSRHR
jgi:excisionase family DNA binding protein